jgi:predicted metal-binding membrane protein
VAGVRAIGRRPTLWIELAVLGAWAALLVGEAAARGSGPGHGAGLTSGAIWICTTGIGGGGTGHIAANASLGSPSLLASTPMWALMGLAMMAPTALPAIRHVAGTSLYWRRRRAAGEFLAIFVALWTGFGILVLTPFADWAPASSPPALAIALAAAALWQLTPLKHRALLACHRSRPLPPRGWRASAGVADFALHNGGACLASCWAMMAAATLAGAGRLWWMAGLTATMAVEKLDERPRRACRRLAALLAAAAIGVALAYLLPLPSL